MSISMNNHETRIKALENKGSGSWTKGSTSTGLWWMENGSGLLIQCSKGKVDTWGNISLPKAYTSTDTYSAVATFGNQNMIRWEPYDSTTLINIMSNSVIDVWCHERNSTFAWITIGYLITNRLLNYIREVIL